MAVGGVQLQLARADLAVARHRQRLHRPERQRRGTGEVVALVEVAQLALGLAGVSAQPRGRGLGDTERRVREGEAAEQVIPVAVGGEQPAGAEAGLLEQRRQQLELVG